MHYLQQAHIPRRLTATKQNRGSALTLITLLHIVAIYAFTTSLHPISVERPNGPIIARFLPTEKEKELPPPPPPTVETPLPPTPVPIDPVIEFTPLVEPTEAITVPTPPVAVPPAEIVTPPPVLAPARAIAGTHTPPEYPLLSRRLGEKGSARLSLTVAEDGTVIDVTVVKSTGFARLDAAAIEWIKRFWRYTPAMRGTMPVKTKVETTLTFRLE